MAYFIQRIFDFAANTGINMTQIAARLATKGLGFDDLVGEDGEILCHATIKYSEKAWDGMNIGLDDVSVVLSDYDAVQRTLSIGKDGNTVAIDGTSGMFLDYTNILGPTNEGSAKQRYVIANVLAELAANGYRFSFEMVEAKNDGNKTVLNIIARDPRTGDQVYVNQMLLKYNVCKYSALGSGESGGYSMNNKNKMYLLSKEAERDGRGLNWTEKDILDTVADEKRLKPDQNFKNNYHGNTRAETNLELDAKFDSEKNDSHMFKIGDVWLKIPPTHVTVSQMRNSYSVPLIGMEAKPLATPVSRTIIKVNVVFTGEEVYDDLIRILTQFKYCPINMLRSKDLFNRVAGSSSDLYKNYSGTYYIPVTMDQYTLFNVDGHPGTVSAVFQFSLFNYSSYLPNPNGLEYYKHDPSLGILLSVIENGAVKIVPDQNKIGQVKFDKLEIATANLNSRLHQTETTWRLEEASHPYNANIEARLAEVKGQKGQGGLYDMTNSKIIMWKVDMDRYFNNTKGLLPRDINLDSEANLDNFMKFCVFDNEVFTEVAQSISITYNNVFAYQPLLSQSHPAAQYIGPGETVVSINLKGINMSDSVDDQGRQTKGDQRLMANILKNWSETHGTAQYGFFDDRYFVRSTLLNIVDANILSIQNAVCTSVESKPGLFDVNILMSKSMFEYNLRNNPIAAYDEYYGLQRMTRIYSENKDLAKLAKSVNEKVRDAYTILTDRMGQGLTINGQSPALNVVLENILTEIKNTKKTYWNGTIDLAEIFKGEIQKGLPFLSNKYNKINSNTIQFVIDVTPQKSNLKLKSVSAPTVEMIDKKYDALKVALKVSNVKTVGNKVTVDITYDSESRLKYLKGVQAYAVYDFSQPKDLVIDNEEVYKNLAIVVNSESLQITTGDSFSDMEEKAKYLAFTQLSNQITSSLMATNAVAPFGITSATFEKVDKDGKTQQLWENKEFMDNYYNVFLGYIGRVPGQYESTGGTFLEDKRVTFIKEMLGGRSMDSAQKAGWQDTRLKDRLSSKSNEYHLATGNSVIIEFNNMVADKLQDIAANKTKEAGASIMKQIDYFITKAGDGNIVASEWKIFHDNKYRKLITLSAKGKQLKDLKKDNILALEIDKNKAIIEKAQKDAKELSYSKPWSAHRYYPLSEGYVGWSQLLSSSVGDWFAYEREEDTVHRINKFKEVANTAKPWNRDAKLFDKNCPNSWYITATEASGMLPYIDVSNPLSALAAIARPKMLRDISAARRTDGPHKGIIPDVQFIKEKGTLVFGDDATKDQTSTNQTFNTVQDWLLYSDSEPEDNQVDYVGADGTLVKAKLKSDELENDPWYRDQQKKIYENEWAMLTNQNVNRKFNCVDTESKFHYSVDANNAMIKHVNQVTNNSIVVNGRAVPFGNATGQTLTDAGINEFGYAGALNDQILKASTAYANINGGYGALQAGTFVRNGVPYKDGKPLLKDMADIQQIPAVNTKQVSNKTETIEGDKLANMLTASYIEGLPSTRGVQNAFPTYKMYIIKSDTSDYKFSSLDDYWDYRLVQDIMIVRDKNTPTHMLKARVVVDPRYITVGQAEDSKFRTGVENRNYGKEESHVQVPFPERDSVKDANIYMKDKAPLRPGMRVCIKLGYHTDPRFLDTVFIGTITQLNGSLDSGLYELAAEGDGRELRVPAVHFSDKFSGENYTDIINAIMRINPNVVHFGKVYGSFLRRLSYGHKNLAQLGMLGVSCAGAFGVGAAGLATAGGALKWGGSRLSAFKVTAGLLPKAGIVGATLGAGVAAAGAASLAAGVLPIAWGEFQQMGQWTRPAFDEIIARSILEQDFWQDYVHRTSRSLATKIPFTGVTKNIPMIGELSGLWKGNVFNANKQSYQLSKHFYQTYKFGNNPLDDNIFAVDIWNSMTKKATLNISNKHSIWDILQTVKRLYPNYALDVRPYGSRSTIFLGPVGFNYWRTDDPVQAMLPQLNQMEGLEVSSGLIDKETRRAIDTNSIQTNQLGDSAIKLNTKISDGLNEKSKALGLTRAPFIPFQKCHLVTSDEDIIMNSLKPTPERGWNAVTVTYGSDPNKVDPKDIIEFMADLDLYPESIIKRAIHVDFTTDAEVATRYALGFLKEGVEKLYGGTIILKGNSKIEPYDKVYLYDKVNKMYGWVQVEAVIHKFDQEMGFTTHIVPNMVCEINNNAYLTTQDIVMSTIWEKGGLGKMAGNFLAGAAVSELATLAGIASGPLFAIGAFAFMAVTAVRDFRNSWEEGKNYVSQFRNVKFSNEQINAEKFLIQDIMQKAIDQDMMIKGLKFGWALGYLQQRGSWQFLYKKEVTLKDTINKATDGYIGRIRRNIGSARTTLRENLGVESPLNEAWKTSGVRSELRERISTIENGELTDVTIKEGENLDAAKKEWSSAVKKFKNVVDKGGTQEEIDATLKTLSDLEKKYYRPEVGKIITEDLGGKIFSNVAKIKEGAAKPGVLTSLAKGSWGSVSKGFKGATNIFKSVFGLGGLAWLAMGAAEFIPSMAYGFAAKAVTKNNVMIVNPVYWRDDYLMPALDGYMANDMFMHIGDMLINAHDTISDAKNAMRNYLPQVLPMQDAKFDAVQFEAVQSVQAAVIDDMSTAGKFITCILKNCGLPGIPMSELADNASLWNKVKWSSIAKSLNNNGYINNTNMVIFLLSLLYRETIDKFSLTEVGPGGKYGKTYGMAQIQTNADGGGNDNILKGNAKSILYSVVDSGTKSAIDKGDFTDILRAKGATESTLPFYIEFIVKSMVDILKTKWNDVYRTFLADPNGRIAKARSVSKSPDMIDAVLLYGSYHGMGYNFKDDMLSGQYIKDDGTVVVSAPPNMNSSKPTQGKYTSQSAIWSKNGFITSYIAMRDAFNKCRQVQNETTSSPTAVAKPLYAFNKFTGPAMRAKLGEYAENQKGVSVKVVYGGAQYKNEWDCSAFVRAMIRELNQFTKNENGDELRKVLLLAGNNMNSQSMYDFGIKLKNGKQVAITDALPGDLVFFKDPKTMTVKHVEICVGNGMMAGVSYKQQDIAVRPMSGTHKQYTAPEIVRFFNY